MTRQRPGIHPGNGRDLRTAKQRSELKRIVNHGGGCIGHDESAKPWAHRLVIGKETAVVADQGVRHDHDLARVRRIGADLLVAGLASIDDEVAPGRYGSTERDTGDERAVLERQESWAEITDARIDHRAWTGRGRRHARGPIRRIETKELAIEVARPMRRMAPSIEPGTAIKRSFPASQNRFAGLTGPAFKGSPRLAWVRIQDYSPMSK